MAMLLLYFLGILTVCRLENPKAHGKVEKRIVCHVYKWHSSYVFSFYPTRLLFLRIHTYNRIKSYPHILCMFHWKNEFCKNTTAVSCKASKGFFAGIKISIRNCESFPLSFLPGLPANATFLMANFYQKFRRSIFTRTIPMSGTYRGYTFPPGAQAVFQFQYFIPLMPNISEPFDSKLKSCSLTVPSYRSTKAPCICQLLPNGNACYSCRAVKLIDTTPDTNDVYYPATLCAE